MKINILNIFYDNMGIIKETLSGSDGSQKKSCLKFLCKCAKIYKDIYNSYCENVDKKNEKNERTCLKLDQIKNSYNLYFTIQDSLNSIIPSLDNNKDDYSVKCRTYQPDTELTSEGRTNSDTPPRMRTPGSAEGSDGNLENVLPTSLGNEGNSMKKSITTTIGTVAGASTILTLLYKFTPAGTLLHSGLRGSGRRINNHAYGDDANELSFNGLVHNDFNSYNIGYEAV
ncbi:hypothetical protein PVIIG_06401 [Plasmodium vivax India VII]|uniref:Vir protein n=1 Tax=Plasmodium vivax India VII TaxID=1077284 RepID=A0A0J9S1J2_PLAVI|nr:hypothetical protein PVIIG_06401 [Plasmodium vivax India VII]